jgi:hypothetical protein
MCEVRIISDFALYTSDLQGGMWETRTPDPVRVKHVL